MGGYFSFFGFWYGGLGVPPFVLANIRNIVGVQLPAANIVGVQQAAPNIVGREPE